MEVASTMNKLKFKIINLLVFLGASSCQYFPQFADAIEEIATDEAISLEISRAAIQKETDVNINVSVINKDIKQAAK